MNFNAGNMSICDECDHERLCDEGEVFYCALSGFYQDHKVDSSECARFEQYLRARVVTTEVGRALDKLDDNGEDAVYEKCRVIDRVADALADYFPEVWTDDLTYELSVPGHGALEERLVAQEKWK